MNTEEYERRRVCKNTKKAIKEEHGKNNWKISIFLISCYFLLNSLNPELNPICYLLALLGAYHFLHVSRIRVKLCEVFWRTNYFLC
jgi:transposase